MKKAMIPLLTLLCVFFAEAQQRIELTKADLFAAGRLPAASEISVMGISVGDRFEDAVKATGKSRGSVKFSGKVYTVEYGDEQFRYISRDNKVVTSIVIFPKFQDKLVGKTSEYFKLMSAPRIKEFLRQNAGNPDYVDARFESIGMVSFIYANGLVFRNFSGENSIGIEDAADTAESVSDPKIKKLEDYGKPVAKPEPSSSAGFRKALWGMTKDQVKAGETGEFLKEDRLTGNLAGLDVLTYKTDDLGMSAFIGYYFADNALTRARYLILESHSDDNLYIGDFESIKSRLAEKYGAPSRDQKIWSNELYKSDPSHFGRAVAAGHVAYVAEWYPSETTIQLLMRGDNFKITIAVEYASDKFREFEKDFIKRSQSGVW